MDIKRHRKRQKNWRKRKFTDRAVMSRAYMTGMCKVNLEISGFLPNSAFFSQHPSPIQARGVFLLPRRTRQKFAESGMFKYGQAVKITDWVKNMVCPCHVG
jgi:hypothetical protein